MKQFMKSTLGKLSRLIFGQIHFLGAALLSMGIVMGLFAEQWWPTPGSLVLVGLLLIGLRLTSGFAKQGWFEPGNRRLLWKMAGAIGVAILLNSAIVAYSSRIDLTENQLYTLSSQTQQILVSLQQPLKVWVFTTNPTPNSTELLTAYKLRSSQFSYEFAEPQSAAAQRFNVQTAGEVYVEIGDRKTFVQSLNPRQELQETTITAGIERALSGPEQIAWLQGHGEPTPESWGAAYRAIRNKNYRIQPLILAQQPLPQATKVLAWIGAQKPLLPPEVTAIDKYLAAGGRLLLLVDPKVDLGATSLLQQRGITLEDRTVRSQFDRTIDNGAVVADYGDHPIGQSFGQNLSLFPLARPIRWQAAADRTVDPILQTSNNSWSAPTATPASQAFQAGTDRRGPLTLGVAVTAQKSRLVAIGSASFIQDGLFDRALNGDLLLNSLNWLSDRGNLAVRPKDITNRRIELSFWQTQTLFWLPVVLLPAASFSWAGWQWWRQR
jgi:ABC-type uncharacterized transport system involved in gliding motility auxiliary subunit